MRVLIRLTAAEEEFRRVVEVLGEAVPIDNLVIKLQEKFG